MHQTIKRAGYIGPLYIVEKYFQCPTPTMRVYIIPLAVVASQSY